MNTIIPSFSHRTCQILRIISGVTVTTGFIISNIIQSSESMETGTLVWDGNYHEGWIEPLNWNATINGTGELITWNDIVIALNETGLIGDPYDCYFKLKNTTYLQDLFLKDESLAKKVLCYQYYLCKRQMDKVAKYMCDWKQAFKNSTTRSNF